MIELWTVDGRGAFIQLCNPGPFSHYRINNETTFWNDPPRWPWVPHRFPLNLYSLAIASKPGQQLLHTTSKCHVGAQHLISPLWSREGRRGNGVSEKMKDAGEREVEGEQGEYEYWMPNVISFICAHVSTLWKGYQCQKRFTRGSAATIAMDPPLLQHGPCTPTCPPY